MKKKIILLLISVLLLSGCDLIKLLFPKEFNMTSYEKEQSYLDSNYVDNSIIPNDLTFKSDVEGFGYYDTLYKESLKENDKYKYFLKKGFPFLTNEIKNSGIMPFGKYIITSPLKDEAYMNGSNTYGGYYYTSLDGKYTLNFYYYYYTPSHDDLSVTLHNGDSINYKKNVEYTVSNVNDSLKTINVYNYDNLTKKDVYIENAIFYDNNSYAISDIDYSFSGKQKDKLLQEYIYERVYKGYFQLTNHTGLEFNISCDARENTNDTNTRVPIEKVTEYTNSCDIMMNELFLLYGIKEQTIEAHNNGNDISSKCLEYLNK